MAIDNSEKIKLVSQAVFDAISKKPGNEVIISDDWVQVTTPKAATPFKNGVYKCVTTRTELSDKIQQTIEHYQKLGLPFRWLVSPLSKPDDIPEALLKKGFKINDLLYGLYGNANKIEIAVNPQVEVKKLVLDNINDWIEVQKNAWKIPEPGLRFMRAEMEQSLTNPFRKSTDYIAYFQGVPVGAGRVSLFDHYAFLTGAAVAESVRGQGIYKTLLAYRLKEIRNGGVESVVIHCLQDTSAPICMKLGFEKVCEIQSYHFA